MVPASLIMGQCLTEAAPNIQYMILSPFICADDDQVRSIVDPTATDPSVENGLTPTPAIRDRRDRDDFRHRLDRNRRLLRLRIPPLGDFSDQLPSCRKLLRSES